MIPYYKLPQNWATSHSHFYFIGPDGLVLAKHINILRNHFKKHKVKQITLFDKDDVAAFKAETLSLSLFQEPEVIIVRVNEKTLSLFPWKMPKVQDRVVIVHGIEKLPKSFKDHEEFDINIRTYSMKEPHLSREIATLLKQQKIILSARGLKWLALSHYGCEYLIQPTINRLKLTFGKNPIPDTDLKAAIYHNSEASSFDIIDALISNPTQLYLFIQSQRSEDWIKLYWALTAYWRKINAVAHHPDSMKQHFPWDSQQKPVVYIIKSLSKNILQTQHMALLELEKHFKGLGQEPASLKLQHWLFATQKAILN